MPPSAGYSEDSAATTACHIKQRPEVEAYINQLLDNRSLRLRITAEEVLLELARIAFADMEEFVNNKEADKDAGESELPENLKTRATPDEKEMLKYYYRRSHGPHKGTVGKCTAASICTMVHIDTYSGRRTTVQFSLTGKIAALKLLGKHLGLFGNKGRQAPPAPHIIFPRMVDVEANPKVA